MYSIARLEGNGADSNPTGVRRSKRARVSIPTHLYGRVIEAIDYDGSKVMILIDDDGKIQREFEVENIETSEVEKITKKDLNEILESDSDCEDGGKLDDADILLKLGVKVKPFVLKHNDDASDESESEFEEDDTESSDYTEYSSEDEPENECMKDELDEHAENEAQEESEYDKHLMKKYASDDDAEGE